MNDNCMKKNSIWEQRIPKGDVDQSSVYCTSFLDFQDSLSDKNVKAIEISANSTIRTCNDPIIANQIAKAFSACKLIDSDFDFDYVSDPSRMVCANEIVIQCQGHDWVIGGSCGPELTVASIWEGEKCTCSDSNHVTVRPCQSTDNWGGIGDGCGQDSTNLRVSVVIDDRLMQGPYCVSIQTDPLPTRRYGRLLSHLGSAIVTINGNFGTVVRGDKNEIIDLCFETLGGIKLKSNNDRSNLVSSWRGFITVTVNGTARGLDCDGCKGLPFDNLIVICSNEYQDWLCSGYGDDYGKYSTHCRNGEVCTLRLSNESYCNNLPDSANLGSENGCRGAVWSDGKPSKPYCKNENKRFPWYKQCCAWYNVRDLEYGGLCSRKLEECESQQDCPNQRLICQEGYCVDSSQCKDTNNGATDTYGYGCYHYKDMPEKCGDLDNEDFSANTMCCACKYTLE